MGFRFQKIAHEAYISSDVEGFIDDVNYGRTKTRTLAV